jgi:malate dehydrogenase (oxaloacetate-decarboxylating)(NADP+)
LACLDLLCDARRAGARTSGSLTIKGVVYVGRVEDGPIKARYAKKTDARTLGDVIVGADVFLGLSAGGVLKPEMVAEHGDKPLIFALANPTPEIMPELVKAVRPTRSSPPAVRTTRTRSTTSSASPSSSAARSMSAPPRITEEMKMAAVGHRRTGRSRGLRKWRHGLRRPVACPSARNT